MKNNNTKEVFYSFILDDGRKCEIVKLIGFDIVKAQVALKLYQLEENIKIELDLSFFMLLEGIRINGNTINRDDLLELEAPDYFEIVNIFTRMIDKSKIF